MRIVAVAAWSTTYRTPSPKTARPRIDRIVSFSLSVGCSFWARTEIPKKKDPRMATMVISVREAFLDSGRRKAGTALEMASTPVRATAPDEKARIRAKRVTPDRAAASLPWVNSWRASSLVGRAVRFPK